MSNPYNNNNNNKIPWESSTIGFIAKNTGCHSRQYNCLLSSWPEPLDITGYFQLSIPLSHLQNMENPVFQLPLQLGLLQQHQLDVSLLKLYWHVGNLQKEAAYCCGFDLDPSIKTANRGTAMVAELCSQNTYSMAAHNSCKKVNSLAVIVGATSSLGKQPSR